jgi:hypothetical protein
VLCSIIGELFILVRLEGGTKVQGLLSCIFFLFSSATIEIFFTVSKPEALQVAYLLMSIVAAYTVYRITSRFSKVLLALFSLVFLLFAFLTKETSLVIFVIFAFWSFVEHRNNRFAGRAFNLEKPTLLLLFYSVIALVVFFGLRENFVNENILTGSYTQNYQISCRTSCYLFCLCPWIKESYLLPELIFCFGK